MAGLGDRRLSGGLTSMSGDLVIAISSAPNRPFTGTCNWPKADLRRCASASLERGQVARGTFSGPRSRGHRGAHERVSVITGSFRPKLEDAANRACARAPSHLPRARGRWTKTWRDSGGAAGRWWCPRAQAPFAVAPQACRARAVLTRLSVVDLGGAPRAWAGERGHRRRPATMTPAGRLYVDRPLWADRELSHRSVSTPDSCRQLRS